jgi:predicted deacylase
MALQHLKDWALSPKNNNIELYASEGISLEKKSSPLVLIGGVHGDEPEGVELAEQTLRWLKKNSAQTPWILIPCLNIDGYKARTRVNGRGVDLNRNYPSRNWSAAFEQTRYYPGPHAGSEPEIQALTRLIENVHPRLVIHFHSWHPSIVLSGPSDLAEARYLSESSGYAVQPSIGYPTPGSLSEYCWSDRSIPVICVEEQEHIDLALVWPHFRAGMEKIFREPSSGHDKL